MYEIITKKIVADDEFIYAHVIYIDITDIEVELLKSGDIHYENDPSLPFTDAKVSLKNDQAKFIFKTTKENASYDDVEKIFKNHVLKMYEGQGDNFKLFREKVLSISEIKAIRDFNVGEIKRFMETVTKLEDFIVDKIELENRVSLLERKISKLEGDEPKRKVGRPRKEDNVKPNIVENYD